MIYITSTNIHISYIHRSHQISTNFSRSFPKHFLRREEVVMAFSLVEARELNDGEVLRAIFPWKNLENVEKIWKKIWKCKEKSLKIKIFAVKLWGDQWRCGFQGWKLIVHGFCWHYQISLYQCQVTTGTTGLPILKTWRVTWGDPNIEI